MLNVDYSGTSVSEGNINKTLCEHESVLKAKVIY